MEKRMSNREEVVITKAECLADGVYSMVLKTEVIAGKAKPGQFVLSLIHI